MRKLVFLLFALILPVGCEDYNNENANQKRPVLATSGVVHYCPDNSIILIERAEYPYGLAMFGGHVEYESIEAGFRREAVEELGISDIRKLQLIGVNSGPGRDSREHMVDVVFSCITSQKPQAGSDAKSAKLFTMEELYEVLQNRKFAFDHKEVIQKYLILLRDCNPCIKECKIATRVN